MYDTAIRSKLEYGLETINLAHTLLSKFSTFQFKGLGKIFKTDTTYVTRGNMNNNNNNNNKVADNADILDTTSNLLLHMHATGKKPF